ncbi:hypothetical protein Ancab_016156 [Ancistrocladus abbreviatus]
MAGGGSSKTNPPKPRKRVEAETPTATLKRARDGSAFARCEECKSSVPVALIDMHSCSLEARIKMNLEAQIVEKKTAEVKKKPAERNKMTKSDSDSRPKKRRLTKVKDPNMPKRPVTAFFLFMEEFRKTYKEEHPDSAKGSVVSKEGGEKWRSMTDVEKKAYIDRAAQLKVEYEEAMKAYQADDSGDNQAGELCDEDA